MEGSEELCDAHEAIDPDVKSTDFDDLPLDVARRVSLTRILVQHSLAWLRFSFEKLPIRMTLSNLGALAVMMAIVLPRALTYVLIYPIFRLVFGTLYPAYASYKAVRTRNVKEYVKWMMYWIVFALFTCAETFTDVFFSFWFPFYYEIKIILVLWLLSPATKGSSILYRRFVHPALTRREAEIDEALARATEQGYTAVLHLGTKGVNYATTVLMQTAIKGGGGLVQQLRKSYSLSDLTGEKMDENRDTPDAQDETDMEVEPRRRENVGRRGYSPRRTQSSSNRVEMYFSEVDVDVRQPRPREPIASLTNIRSSDDISSGYSSGEALQSHRATSQGESLVRTSSVGARTRAKPRSITKKTPEDADEEKISDSKAPVQSFSLPSSRSPSISLTPEQAYEILLMLSQCPDPNELLKLKDRISGKASAKDEFVELESESTSRESSEEFVEISGGPSFEAAVSFADKSIPLVSAEVKEIREVIEPLKKSNEDKGEVEPKIEEAKAETIMDKVVSGFDKDKVAESKAEPVPINKTTDAKDNAVGSNKSISFADQKEQEKVNDGKPSSVDIDVKKITDEMCQEKFDELKELLNTAHQAVTSIVSAQEKLSKPVIESISEDSRKVSDANSSETVPNSNVSQANSEDPTRAGKYHKKPAPKAPNAEGPENSDHEDTESQSALKATLVIKTGTLKTFSNPDASKDVFFAHAQDAKKKKKSARTRTKEGFSKLLTIPKNIFHNAFHKDQNDSSLKGDDSTSIVSEASGSKSRSVSVGSRDVFLDADSKEFGQENETKNIESPDRNNEQSKDEAYVNLHPNDSEQTVPNTEKSDKSIDQITADEKKEVVQVDINGVASKEDKDDVAKPKVTIPQMSHEPRGRRETITDIF